MKNKRIKRLMSKVEQLKDTTYNNADIAIYELMLDIAEIITPRLTLSHSVRRAFIF